MHQKLCLKGAADFMFGFGRPLADSAICPHLVGIQAVPSALAL